MRKNLLDLSNTNCFRLVHAEGDSLPGIIADVYNNTVVLQILHKGTENILEHIATSLHNLGFEYLYLNIHLSYLYFIYYILLNICHYVLYSQFDIF